MGGLREITSQMGMELELDLSTESITDLVIAKREAKKFADLLESFTRQVNEELVTRLSAGGLEYYTVTEGVDVPLKCQMLVGRSPSKLDAKLLAQAGVAASVIQKCTVEGATYTYIKVTEVKTKS